MGGYGDIATRLDRAEEHLRTLETEVAAYANSRPYRVEIDSQSDYKHIAQNWSTFSSEDQKRFLNDVVHVMVAEVSPPPQRLAALVSDILHNLRSCLEHLAWQLVAANSSSDPVHGRNRREVPEGGLEPLTSFPIRTRPIPQDPDGSKKPLMWPRTTDAVEAVLDALQPYHAERPFAHPLAIIQRLSNTDKHEALHLTVASLGGGQVRVILPGGRFIGVRWNASVLGTPDGNIRPPFEKGTQIPAPVNGDIMIFLITHPAQVKVEADLPIFVSLDKSPAPKDPDVVALMGSLIHHVRHEVVPSLVPFLPV